MSFTKNFVKEINELLMTKRHPDDVSFTLHIPEHKFKKVSEKFNYALSTTYEKYKDMDVKLFHIILSLQEYFEMDTLVSTILDPKLTRIIKKEMQEEYHISGKSRRRKTNAKKTSYS